MRERQAATEPRAPTRRRERVVISRGAGTGLKRCNLQPEGNVVKRSVVNQVQGGEVEGGRAGGEGRCGGERGGDSPAAFPPSERIMADGPRCKRRKQANPRRTSGE